MEYLIKDANNKTPKSKMYAKYFNRFKKSQVNRKSDQ